MTVTFEASRWNKDQNAENPRVEWPDQVENLATRLVDRADDRAPVASKVVESGHDIERLKAV